MTIEARHVTKRFDRFTALDAVDLTVADGELVALLGPSGSGKTTLLRLIAGLDWATEGQILFDGVDASGRGVGERQVGFVFQHYALFRHMTVFENVAFGLRVKSRRQRPTETAIREKVLSLLALVQLDQFARRYPAQLSGGQRQRVALARALAIEPRVLLLDEPFGALDARVRKELRRWLRRLHDDMGLTSVFVTHDQEEALEMADRVVVMNEGKIAQMGPPAEVYDHPASPFVFEFLGQVNRVPCTTHTGQVRVWDCAFDVPEATAGDEQEAVAYVRPHDVDVFAGAVRAGRPAIVEHLACAGPVARLDLFLPDEQAYVTAEVSRPVLADLKLKPGQEVFIRPRIARVFLNGTYADHRPRRESA